MNHLMKFAKKRQPEKYVSSNQDCGLVSIGPLCSNALKVIFFITKKLIFVSFAVNLYFQYQLNHIKKAFWDVQCYQRYVLPFCHSEISIFENLPCFILSVSFSEFLCQTSVAFEPMSTILMQFYVSRISLQLIFTDQKNIFTDFTHFKYFHDKRFFSYKNNMWLI